MKQTTRRPNHSLKNPEPMGNRRLRSRTNSRLSITVSYVDGHRFAMDHGHVTDLSETGMGLRGHQALTAGMEVALFIALPHSDDHLCIPEARVSWARGRRFGLALRTLKDEDQDRLALLLAGHAPHPTTRIGMHPETGE
jgi:hypothetical protein